MSGHSKWAKLKHTKGALDTKRGNVFTKLCRAIMVCARQGGSDPLFNFALRLAIDKARAFNVPKDNIDKAIKRGTGELKDGVIIEEALYEGFGPGGSAFLIECATDNKNRTLGELKTTLSKNGGSLAGQGAVKWQFEHKGVIRVPSISEDLELRLIDAGAEDIAMRDGVAEVTCPVSQFQKVMEVFAARQIEPTSSGLEWMPKETVMLTPEDQEKLAHLFGLIEKNDDVQEIYANV